ncbi:MAG: hypothetical protein Kilf2KO_02210 [Rhodospirillales bacterium]
MLLCGAPKTGSTSLQTYFRDREPLLKRHGIHYPHRFFAKRDVDPIHRSFVRSRRPRERVAAIEAARARLEVFFAKDGVETILLSNESLLGEPILQGRSRFFDQAGDALGALGEIFRGYDVEVRYVIRSFTSYLPSYYVQSVRRGSYGSFPEFVAALDLDSLSWRPVVGLLAATFGAEVLRVFDHRALLEDPDAVLQAMLLDSLGEPLPPFDAAHYRMNRSVGGPALKAAALANRILAPLSPHSPHRRGMVTRSLVLKPLSWVLPAGKPRLPPALEAELEQRYAAERLALVSG